MGDAALVIGAQRGPAAIAASVFDARGWGRAKRSSPRSRHFAALAAARRVHCERRAPSTLFAAREEDDMHDIDRSFMEMEDESFEFGNEGEGSYEGGMYEAEVLGEGEVEQLASELLSLNSEDELDHFLGSLIKKVGSAVGKVVQSPIGKQIGGALKGLAKQALPMAGSALGNMIVPGLGGMLGDKLASQAGSLFGLELEGLSQEDQQFEVAKQYVRLASDAIKSAVSAPPSAPTEAVRTGLVQAAQKFAPGLIAGAGAAVTTAMPNGRGMSGRWVRRGRKIVLYGV
jgi:hypothetical protein